MQAIQDKVIIKPIQETHDGFIQTLSTDEKPDQGIVVSVGKGKYNQKGVLAPNDVQIGDHVIFNRFTAVPLGDKEHIVVFNHDITGVIE